MKKKNASKALISCLALSALIFSSVCAYADTGNGYPQVSGENYQVTKAISSVRVVKQYTTTTTTTTTTTNTTDEGTNDSSAAEQSGEGQEATTDTGATDRGSSQNETAGQADENAEQVQETAGEQQGETDKTAVATETSTLSDSQRAALAGYITGANPAVGSDAAMAMVGYFEQAASKYGVDIRLLMAIAQTESTYQETVVSGSGAVGIMQIMPSTAAGYGVSGESLYNAQTNIDFGASYIAELLNTFGGDEAKALSGYNQGPEAVSGGYYSTSYAVSVLGNKAAISSIMGQ